jgi:hypothetical protein
LAFLNCVKVFGRIFLLEFIIDVDVENNPEAKQ